MYLYIYAFQQLGEKRANLKSKWNMYYILKISVQLDLFGKYCHMVLA